MAPLRPSLPARGEPVEPYERAGHNVGLPAKLVLVETGSGHPEGGGDGFLLPETIAQPPNAPFDVIPRCARNLRRCAVVMRRFQPQGSSWGMRAFRFLTPLCSVRNDSWSVFSQDGAQSYAKVSGSRNRGKKDTVFQPTLAIPARIRNARRFGLYPSVTPLLVR